MYLVKFNLVVAEEYGALCVAIGFGTLQPKLYVDNWDTPLLTQWFLAMHMATIRVETEQFG